MEKQEIKCRVYDCKHCNCDCDMCKLECIEVCNCKDTETKDATMCDSYEKK